MTRSGPARTSGGTSCPKTDPIALFPKVSTKIVGHVVHGEITSPVYENLMLHLDRNVDVRIATIACQTPRPAASPYLIANVPSNSALVPRGGRDEE